jgi:hypothetical protein
MPEIKFINKMPNDEDIHAKRAHYFYAECTQHCIPKGEAKNCKGIDYCMVNRVVTNAV